MVLVLNKKDLLSLLTPSDSISAVEDGYAKLALRKVMMPQRTIMHIEDPLGFFGVMPVASKDIGGIAIKIISTFPSNFLQVNLPPTMGFIALHDVSTGQLLALMDGVSLTAFRTSAASGVATKYLSRANSEVVGIFGTGVQARAQLEAVCSVRPIKHIKTYDTQIAKAKEFSKDMSNILGVDITPCNDPKETVTESDIVITCSTSTTPVFDGRWLSVGTHINGIGSHRPEVRELDSITIKRSKIVVDSVEACLKEAGDIIIPINEGAITQDHLYTELGEIILGNKAGRINDDEITLFKSVGVAVQDLAITMKAYNLAKERGVGNTIEL